MYHIGVEGLRQKWSSTGPDWWRQEENRRKVKMNDRRAD
jgi:hypothetical protein